MCLKYFPSANCHLRRTSLQNLPSTALREAPPWGWAGRLGQIGTPSESMRPFAALAPLATLAALGMLREGERQDIFAVEQTFMDTV